MGNFVRQRWIFVKLRFVSTIQIFEMAAMPFPCNGLVLVVLISLNLFQYICELFCPKFQFIFSSIGDGLALAFNSFNVVPNALLISVIFRENLIQARGQILLNL